MAMLPDFRLETHFSAWELKTRYRSESGSTSEDRFRFGIWRMGLDEELPARKLLSGAVGTSRGFLYFPEETVEDD